ncbi:XdhC family protein [Dactylosporangium sp. NPDC049742]|uniref:XdhC family protein n=1 Tax=Dactylosporangium sp. NPDC049742 TaxID=3154737 RepID=UPI0034181D7A
MNTTRALVAVFDTPVAAHLLDFATTLGFRVALADPDLESVVVDADTDVVVTDHDRPELGAVLRDALASPARWIGVMGNPRHPGPHVEALRGLGVPDDEIARVHRPIGLNIGSRTPPEIALATLAGLVADRNGRPGGTDFQ